MQRLIKALASDQFVICAGWALSGVLVGMWLATSGNPCLA